MQHLLIAFYVTFFATGFMGAAALVVLLLRLRSRVIPLLLTLQLLFLVGIGIVTAYYYAIGVAGSLSTSAAGLFAAAATLVNAAVYVVAFIVIRRMAPPATRVGAVPAIAEVLAGLVIAKTVANLVLASLGPALPQAAALLASDRWQLGGYVLSGFAIASFGLILRGRLPDGEPKAIRPLLRAYGVCALIFAPLFVVEYLVEIAQVPGFASVSLDHLLYFAWNIVSMGAIIKLFAPADRGEAVLESVPAERIRALSLSPREVEMAELIARGMSNKEIASELFISPATVRTHVYNLYRKVGVRSRVEMLNRLKS